MKKISRRSFLAAAGLTVAALALTACGGSASTASSAAASSSYNRYSFKNVPKSQ